jgi:hypothetical protein
MAPLSWPDCWPRPGASCRRTLRVNHICCWVNDLYAHAREASRGDTFNLITILSARSGHSTSQAARIVAAAISAELAALDFLLACHSFPRRLRFVSLLRTRHGYINLLNAAGARPGRSWCDRPSAAPVTRLLAARMCSAGAAGLR